jgi:hypothetical protein
VIVSRSGNAIDGKRSAEVWTGALAGESDALHSDRMRGDQHQTPRWNLYPIRDAVWKNAVAVATSPSTRISAARAMSPPNGRFRNAPESVRCRSVDGARFAASKR